jgi:hypothetical protein
MLAVAAILFVLGSAIIAFQGWPRIASQGSPVAVQIDAAPASPSRVSRRLRAVAPAWAVVRAAGRPGRPATRPVGLSGSVGAPPTGLAPSRAIGGGHGVTRAGSGTKSPSGAPSGITVSTPTHPPVTITVPTGGVPAPVKSVARNVTRNLRAPSPTPPPTSGPRSAVRTVSP